MNVGEIEESPYRGNNSMSYKKGTARSGNILALTIPAQRSPEDRDRCERERQMFVAIYAEQFALNRRIDYEQAKAVVKFCEQMQQQATVSGSRSSPPVEAQGDED